MTTSVTKFPVLKNKRSHYEICVWCGRYFRNMRGTQFWVNIMDRVRWNSDKIWAFYWIVNVIVQNVTAEPWSILEFRRNQYTMWLFSKVLEHMLLFSKIVLSDFITTHVTVLFPWRIHAQNSSFFSFHFKKISFLIYPKYIHQRNVLAFHLLLMPFNEAARLRWNKHTLLVLVLEHPACHVAHTSGIVGVPSDAVWVIVQFGARPTMHKVCKTMRKYGLSGLA